MGTLNFTFEARNTYGDQVQGEIEGANIESVVETLSTDRKYCVISIQRIPRMPSEDDTI